MKVSIATEKFKLAVSKAGRGASCDKELRMTSLLGLRHEDGDLILSTTDKINTFEVVIPDIKSDEDFNITVPVTLFSKLIAKFTSDLVTLSVSENTLIVEGNGTYKVPIEVDEDGFVKAPEITMIPSAEDKTGEINLADVHSIYNTNKASLGVADGRTPLYLSGYFVNEEMVLTSDNDTVCFNAVNLFNSEEPLKVLLTPEIVNLLTLCTDDKIVYTIQNNDILYTTDTIRICGKVMNDVDKYPVSGFSSFLTAEFKNSCVLDKNTVLSVLDRLALFTSEYDRNCATLKFSNKTLTIASKQLNSVETVALKDDNGTEDFECTVNVPTFKEQLEACPTNDIEVQYGNDTVLKFLFGKITQIIALEA